MKIIDADKRYFYPNEAPLAEWFNEFNERFFEKQLPPLELKVVWGSKNTLGGFRRPERKIDDPFKPEDCSIVLNCRYFESEDEWRNTILHEMVHYYVFMVYGTCVKSHGKEFKTIAKRINASSEFVIDTYSRNKSFRPKPSITDNWGSHFEEEIILGSYIETRTKDYSDELDEILDELGEDKTHEPFLIEVGNYSHSFSFRTKRRYIPEIIDNLRNVRGEIKWFQVDECCQKLFLLPITTAVPSFKSEDTYRAFADEADLFDDFGPIKWTLLGTTEFREDSVQGFVPGQRKEEFRQQYFRDAKEIGKLAAEMLVKRYLEHPRWYKTSIHGTYNVKPSCGDYAILVDSRFNPLVAMTPKKILINPVHSEIMMDHIKNGDTDSLAHEITRVIESRR